MNQLVKAKPPTKEQIEASRLDFVKNYKPLLQQMDDWRRKSALGEI